MLARGRLHEGQIPMQKIGGLKTGEGVCLKGVYFWELMVITYFL